MDAESYINKVEDINVKRALQILSANYRRLSGRLLPVEELLGADPADKDSSVSIPPHNLLSPTHPDTVDQAPNKGDMIYGDEVSGAFVWKVLAVALPGRILTTVVSGPTAIPSWEVFDILDYPHAAEHATGGGDPFTSAHILEAVVKRLRESSGPTTLTVGAVADGDFLKRSGANIIGASPGASSVSFTEVEIDLGSTPRYNGKVSFFPPPTHVVGDPVLIFQAKGPYTGKGNLEDEAEMDAILATGWVKVVGGITEEIEVFWWSRYPVVGNFKFNYIVG